MFPLQGAGWSVFRCYSVRSMFRYWSPGSAFPTDWRSLPMDGSSFPIPISFGSQSMSSSHRFHHSYSRLGLRRRLLNFRDRVRPFDTPALRPDGREVAPLGLRTDTCSGGVRDARASSAAYPQPLDSAGHAKTRGGGGAVRPSALERETPPSTHSLASGWAPGEGSRACCLGLLTCHRPSLPQLGDLRDLPASPTSGRGFLHWNYLSLLELS